MENENNIAALTAAIEASPKDIALYILRGKAHLRENNFGGALNDFNTVLDIEAEHIEAGQYVRMINEILEYRYKDIYNP